MLGGPGIDAMLTEMGKFLASVPPIILGAGLECSVGERLTVGNAGTTAASTCHARVVLLRPRPYQAESVRLARADQVRAVQPRQLRR